MTEQTYRIREEANPFVYQPQEYTRYINPLKTYVDDAAFYLSTQTGDDIQQCREFVLAQIREGGQFQLKDPGITYFQRMDNGDREKKTTPVLDFLKEVVVNKEILSPSWVAYTNPEKERSILAIDMIDKIQQRSQAKKEQFKAEAARNDPTLSKAQIASLLFIESLKKTEQSARKTSNNGTSGATCVASTPLYCPTTHTTLTSTCRTTSGYGNANNERLLGGGRHYRSYQITLNNIVSICNHTDYVQLNECMRHYGLVYPTAQDAMNCVLRSSRLYWPHPQLEAKLFDYLCKLSPEQLAAFVYTGDLYQLKTLNNDVIHDFIDGLSSYVTGEHPDPMSTISKANDEYVNLCHQICTPIMAGKGKDYKRLTHQEQCDLALTMEHVSKHVDKYALFIRTFIRTDNLPPSVSYFPDAVRRIALMSDTDSTIFTAQDWVFWFMGDTGWFSNKGISVQAAMTFLAANSIIHILATMSGNIGVETKEIHRCAMKSEFRFDVFVPTMIGKTYFANIGSQEGNIKPIGKPGREIKGVQLKNSNAPAFVNDQAERMMYRIMDTVQAGEKISLLETLTEVADIERTIISSIQKGETTYLRRGSVKTQGTYKNDVMKSPYLNHLLWAEVFAPKYGHISPPPYMTAKLSLKTDNKADFQAWLMAMEDQSLAKRLADFFRKAGRDKFTTFHAPVEVLKSKGVVPEIAGIIDYPKIAGELTNAFRLILGTLGFDARWDGKNPTLISQLY